MTWLIERGLRKLSSSLHRLVRASATEYPILFEGDCPVWLQAEALYLPLVGLYSATLDEERLRRLDQEPGVRRIYWDRPVAAALDRARRDADWYGPASCIWDGRGMGIALVDSGCAPHPDLADAVVDFVDLVRGERLPYDDYGHGTHLAGVMVGRGRVEPRLRGMAPGAHLVVVKVLNEAGVGRESTIIRGLEVVVGLRRRWNIRVVNLSLGGQASGAVGEDPLCRAVERLWRLGLAVVTPAGNEGRKGDGSIQSPGTSPLVITVGALTRARKVARFSSRGGLTGPLKPDLVAPGTGIVAPLAAGSTLDLRHPERRRGAYAVQSGSSVAAAIVSGALAVLFAKEAHLTADEAKERLMDSAEDLGLPWNLQGAGALRLTAALALDLPVGRLLGRRQLRQGDFGNDVWYAQNRLNLLGYTLVGPASGCYDQRTAAAVARFQSQSWLPVTGVLDLLSGRALEATGWLGRRVLKAGMRGEDVAELQVRLSLPVSGLFDAATEATVRTWQVKHGIQPCGRVDRHTYWRLGLASLHLPDSFPLDGNPVRLNQ